MVMLRTRGGSESEVECERWIGRSSGVEAQDAERMGDCGGSDRPAHVTRVIRLNPVDKSGLERRARCT